MNRITRLVVVGLSIGVATTSVVFAQEFTQGFASDEKLLRGAVVSRIEGDDSKVEGAAESSIERLYGVVVRSNETAVVLTNDTAGVLVTTSGKYEVLVSNINGEIQVGDYITASPIKGVAMKADQRQSKTIGQAVQAFDSTDSNVVLATRQVTSNEGQSKTIAIGRILADMDVRNSPLSFGIEAPEIIIRIGEAIAGGPVAVTRVWGALGVLVLSFLTGSTIFYAGVRTSIIAIGRNPLSKASVLRGFFQVTAISFSIFIVGGFAVYLILKL